jgi:arsenite methyltransferase
VEDQWSRWLLNDRYGVNEDARREMISTLHQYRALVLEHASITSGDTVLDIGCGDGLIAFAALPLVGERGTVIFSDISPALLEHCQKQARQQGVLARCRFVQAAAEDLAGIASQSVDVVTMRSVLIYVQAKEQALRECYRVLKPGGRLSLFEPIIQHLLPEPAHLFGGYEVRPIKEIVQKLRGEEESTQTPAARDNPMMDFTEHDLFRYAERAGFSEIHLELQMTTAPSRREGDTQPASWRWESFLHSAPNPLAPTLESVLRARLTEDEIRQFTAYLRPLVERVCRVERSAIACLWARK